MNDDSVNKRSALWLCLVIFVIALFQFIPGFTDFFILDSSLAFPRVWTLVTAIFLHGGVGHLLYNLLGLALFGSILEHIIGTRRFLWLFFISGLTASLVSLPFYARVLGASGAIFGILGMLGVLRPKMMVWVYSMPLPMALAVVVWGVGDFIMAFMPTGTANIAHLGGLGVGLAAGFYYYSRFKEHKEPPAKLDEQKVTEFEKTF